MALAGAQSPALSVVRNIYEADSLQATAMEVAVDKEITFRSTAALVQLSTDLGLRIGNAASEAVILDA